MADSGIHSVEVNRTDAHATYVIIGMKADSGNHSVEVNLTADDDTTHSNAVTTLELPGLPGRFRLGSGAVPSAPVHGTLWRSPVLPQRSVISRPPLTTPPVAGCLADTTSRAPPCVVMLLSIDGAGTVCLQ